MDYNGLRQSLLLFKESLLLSEYYNIKFNSKASNFIDIIRTFNNLTLETNFFLINLDSKKGQYYNEKYNLFIIFQNFFLGIQEDLISTYFMKEMKMSWSTNIDLSNSPYYEYYLTRKKRNLFTEFIFECENFFRGIDLKDSSNKNLNFSALLKYLKDQKNFDLNLHYFDYARCVRNSLHNDGVHKHPTNKFIFSDFNSNESIEFLCKKGEKIENLYWPICIYIIRKCLAEIYRNIV